MIAMLAIGFMAFGIARGALLRADAQTAADAAALAGARNIRDQLRWQMAVKGYASLAAINPALVQAAAAEYARRNDGHLTRPVRIEGADVRVWAATDDDVGRLGEPSDSETRRGEARARGRVALAVGVPTGGGGFGGAGGLNQVKPLDCSKKDLEIDAEGGARGIVEDAVRVAQCAGGSAIYVCSGYRPGSITTSGNPSDHGSDNEAQAARDISMHGIDCIHGPPPAALNAAVVAIGKALGRDYGDGAHRIVDTFEFKGYRVQIIWHTPEYGGHLGHIHIGARKGGVASGGGTGPGGFEISQLMIKLVDWEAPGIADFTINPLGSAGANPFGPPDPAVAEKLCQALDATDASPKARLALWEAAIVESGVHDLPDGHSSSVGVLQLLDIHLGGSVAARRDVVRVATLFLLKGFTGQGGAIALAKAHPEWNAGQVAQAVQGSAYPLRYDQRREQAIALNQKFCGGKGL